MSELRLVGHSLAAHTAAAAHLLGSNLSLPSVPEHSPQSLFLRCLLNSLITSTQGEGDTVTARVLPDQPGVVVIDSITGDNGRLSLVAADNCVGIAAAETLKLLGSPTCGVGLTLHKVCGCALGGRRGLGKGASRATAGCGGSLGPTL